MEDISEDDLRTFFKKYDQDNSGKIDKKELTQLLEEIGMKLEGDQLEEFLKMVDEDGSGQIEFDEFKKLVMGD